MHKIIPFKKDISFKTNVAEIISIALEHTMKVEDNYVKGEFLLNGTYKINESSINVDEFNFNLPFSVEISDKYALDQLTLEIEDFYYEVLNNNLLKVNIDIKIDNLVEIMPALKPVECEDRIEVKSLFDNLEEKEEYTTYKVCIVKENDTIESIMLKYNMNREMLEKYNDLTEIKINDKIIIPSILNDNQ